MNKPLERYFKKLFALANPPESVELVQLSAKGGRSTIDEIKLEGDPRDYGDPDKIEELVGSIMEVAQNDADGWGSVCRYCLVAKLDTGNSIRSPVFRLSGENDDIEGSEPASPDGLLSQLMRHNEAYARSMATMMGATVSHLTDTIARLTDKDAQNEKNKLDMWQMMEELASENHKRQIEAKREDVKVQAMKRIVNGVSVLMPNVAGKLLLGDKAPQSVKSSPQFATLKQIVESMSPEQTDALLKILSPEQSAALFEILTSIAEDNKKDEEDEPEEIYSFHGSN